MVHNDYTYELAPKFEFFADRFEVTSYGGLPQGLSQEEFFEGISIPRSKELMRVFRDMELVEQLGSGVPRILQSYSRECFHFSDNYIRMSFPMAEVQTGEVFNVGANVGANKLIEILSNNPGLNSKQLNENFDVSSRTIERWIKQLRTEGKIEFKGEPKTGGYWVVQEGEN